MNRDLILQIKKHVQAGLRVSIAPDHYRLSKRGGLRSVIELDTWFGPPFRASQLDDPHQVQTALYRRSFDLGPSAAYKAGLLTEFRWNYKDGIKSVEIEELPNPEHLDGSQPVLCRFIHSQRDIHTQSFIHIDGAVTVYDYQRFQRRYETAQGIMREKIKANAKPKLFRVDSVGSKAVNLTDWQSMVSLFFRGNELVLEYFSGKKFSEIYKEQYRHDHPWLESACNEGVT